MEDFLHLDLNFHRNLLDRIKRLAESENFTNEQVKTLVKAVKKRNALVFLVAALLTRKKREIDDARENRLERSKELKKAQKTVFRRKCEVMKMCSSFTEREYGVPKRVYWKIAHAVKQVIESKPNATINEFNIAAVFMEAAAAGTNSGEIEKITGFSKASIGMMIRTALLAIKTHLHAFKLPNTPEEWNEMDFNEILFVL